MASTRSSLQELFDRAGIARAKTPEALRQAGFALRRQLRRIRFAQCYVGNDFTVLAAYRDFNPRFARHKHWHRQAYRWVADLGVARYVREIVQEATEGVKEHMRTDLTGVRDINSMILRADATALIEQVTETDQLGNTSVYTRFKPVADLTDEQRMVVYKIRLKHGEVVSMEPYPRDGAMRLHCEILQSLEQKGGSDESWTHVFKQRMGKARQQKLDLETAIAAGKVLMLPTKRA